MITSIRKFLLINLLISIAFTTALSALGNYFLYHKDLERHMDATLSQAALVLQSMIATNTSNERLKHLQSYLDNFTFNMKNQISDDYGTRVQFQVWDENSNLVLHSYGSPRSALTEGITGFANKTINHENWRVFTLSSPDQKLTFVVAELFNIRNELERKITSDYLYTLLLTYPLLGLLIWITVGRGLSSIRRVTNDVAHRDPTRLESVDTEAVPNEIKPLLNALNQLFSRLREGFEREKRFAGDAAHELRTPLAALRTQTQVALNAMNEAEQQKALQNILASVDRSTHVVEQLLTLSRLVPGTPISDIIACNLATLAAEVIAMLAPIAFAKQIEIELDSGDRRPIVEANSTALIILIRNLIDNAIRYTPPGGKIMVQTIHKGRHVLLKVTDNGPGIDEKLRERVFERFFRVLGSKESGSGLGLAIVHQIATLHNAKVSLQTAALGQGLEVQVKFLAL